METPQYSTSLHVPPHYGHLMISETPENCAADAEAILIAARQPEMRFVAPKTADQQAKAVPFRGRERLVHQRTEMVNALRAVLYEYGHVFPIGFGHVKRIAAVVEDPGCDLPALVIAECQDLLAQIAEKTERIEAKTLEALAAETDTARRLQTMSGVGPPYGSGGPPTNQRFRLPNRGHPHTLRRPRSRWHKVQ